MPYTTVGYPTPSEDGYVFQYGPARNMASNRFYWGSNNTSSYGFEPYTLFRGISIPKRRGIISAKAYLIPANTIGSRPTNAWFSIENNVAPVNAGSYSEQEAKVLFPKIDAPIDSWNEGVPYASPDVTTYVQTLVMNNAWEETNSAIWAKFGLHTPYYTGSQRIVQAWQADYGVETRPSMEIVYSANGVNIASPTQYSGSTSNTASNSWQGYRINISRKITIISVMAGSLSANTYAAIYEDNNGTAGNVIASNTIDSSWNNARFSPIVLEPGWYWIAAGSTVNDSRMRQLSTNWNKESFLSQTSFLSAFDGPYWKSPNNFGQPSVFTGTDTSTPSLNYKALGFQYVEGDIEVDDTTPPSLVAAISGAA